MHIRFLEIIILILSPEIQCRFSRLKQVLPTYLEQSLKPAAYCAGLLYLPPLH